MLGLPIPYWPAKPAPKSLGTVPVSSLTRMDEIRAERQRAAVNGGVCLGLDAANLGEDFSARNAADAGRGVNRRKTDGVISVKTNDTSGIR